MDGLARSAQARMVSFPSCMETFENNLKEVLAGRAKAKPLSLDPGGAAYIDDANFNLYEYPFPDLLVKVCRRMKMEKTLIGYSTLGGFMELRAALAELGRLRSGNPDPNFIGPWNVFVGNSASSLLDKIIQLVLLLDGKKNEVIFHYPVYPIFDFSIRRHGGKPVPIKTAFKNKFLPTPEEIKGKITPRTAAICLVYPCNPGGGTFLDKAALEKILLLARENGVPLIVDEIYQGTMHADKKHISILSLLDSLDGIVSVTSLSKDRSGFSDLRIGYCLGDFRIAYALQLMASSQEWQAPSFVQQLLMIDTSMRIARRGGEYKGHLAGIGLKADKKEVEAYCSGIDSMMKKMERHTKLLHKILAGAPWIEKIVAPEAANVLFFKVRSSSLKKFKRRLDKAKIQIGRGSSYYMHLREGKGWYRITVTQPIEYLLRAVNELYGFSAQKSSRIFVDQLAEELVYDPKNQRLLLAYAGALLNLDRFKEVSRVLDRVAPAGDIMARYQLYYLWGTLWLKRGQYKRGSEFLEKAGRVPVEEVMLLPEGRSISKQYYEFSLNIYSKSRLYN